MKRYFVRLAYNGTNYHGWQIQENAHTVQAEVNDKLSTLLSTPINVVGCGRTDTGVHAREFYLHFELDQVKYELADLCYKLDKFLPPDIVIYDIFEVRPELHARFSAKNRTYRYYVTRKKDPFENDFSLFYNGKLDLNQMNKAAKYLFEYKDFSSFSKLHTQSHTNLCEIIEAMWVEQDYMLMFTIKANRFLRNMVRAIVGTMLEIGSGKLRPDDMKFIIEAQDRTKAGFSVPAHGLFLEEVAYDFD